MKLFPFIIHSDLQFMKINWKRSKLLQKFRLVKNSEFSMGQGSLEVKSKKKLISQKADWTHDTDNPLWQMKIILLMHIYSDVKVTFFSDWSSCASATGELVCIGLHNTSWLGAVSLPFQHFNWKLEMDKDLELNLQHLFPASTTTHLKT